MSVAGLKKQFHKASQFVSEKVGGAEGTKLDDDFTDMERVRHQGGVGWWPEKIDTTSKATLDIITKTQEYLQPNPASRAKLGMLNTMSKIRGQQHLKKLEGRRLDYDYKKKRHGKIPEDEIRQSVEKFEESKEDAESSMFNLLESDVEQVSQLAALVEAQLEYHRQAAVLFEQLQKKLQGRVNEAARRPKQEFKPKAVFDDIKLKMPDQANGGIGSLSFAGPQKKPAASSVSTDQPKCKALFDFEPENDGELGFKEGDVITLTNQIDDNWFEGMLQGQSGFFPINYVEVLVPLPQ
uniref:endophilin-A2-like isoform X3 n=1 Tax=Myxine glutinosa TaxID=7769 RepID=UPI00358F1A61